MAHGKNVFDSPPVSHVQTSCLPVDALHPYTIANLMPREGVEAKLCWVTDRIILQSPPLYSSEKKPRRFGASVTKAFLNPVSAGRFRLLGGFLMWLRTGSYTRALGTAEPGAL
jgi:hypothetical protein